VRSHTPLWDQPELRELGHRVLDPQRTLAEGHETMGTTVVDADPESILPMPEATFVPIVTALGITLVFFGFLTLLYPAIVLGGLIMVGGILSWVRPKALP
jgi:hypothetical protein